VRDSSGQEPSCTGDGGAFENPWCKYVQLQGHCVITPGCNFRGVSSFGGWCEGSSPFCASQPAAFACAALSGCRWVAARAQPAPADPGSTGDAAEAKTDSPKTLPPAAEDPEAPAAEDGDVDAHRDASPPGVDLPDAEGTAPADAALPADDADDATPPAAGPNGKVPVSRDEVAPPADEAVPLPVTGPTGRAPVPGDEAAPSVDEAEEDEDGDSDGDETGARIGTRRAAPTAKADDESADGTEAAPATEAAEETESGTRAVGTADERAAGYDIEAEGDDADGPPVVVVDTSGPEVRETEAEESDVDVVVAPTARRRVVVVAAQTSEGST